MKKKQTKLTAKTISLLLALAMLLTMQGVPALAEMAGEAASAEHTRETREMPKNPVHTCTKKDDCTDMTEWSYVYFGSYPQTEVTGDALTAAITGASYDVNGDAWVNGTKYRRISKSDTNYDGYFGDSEFRYFKWERIKWRVLNVNNSTMFVAADKGLDCKDYNEEVTSVTWENCTLRNWLNNDFYGMAFGSREQGAIVSQTVVNEDNPYHNVEGGSDTTDKVYLLSLSEVRNLDYGFCEDGTWSVSRRVKASDYAHARGAYAENCTWWLRSPGCYTDFAAYVDSYGVVNSHGIDVNVDGDVCVPALHINLSSDLWSVADDGTSGGGEGGGAGTDPAPTGSSIRCAASCSVEAGSTGYVVSQVYGDDKESLKKLMESVTWESQDTSIVAIGRHTGYILPLAPNVYETENGFHEVWSSMGALAVTGVSEGTTTVTGTAADGSVAVCKITVSTKEEKGEGSIGSGGSLTLGEDIGGNAGGEAAGFFPSTWSLQSTVFPVEISKTEEEDGSFKIKGSIGVGKSDWLKDDAKWNQFKSNVNDAQKYTGRVDCLNSYRKTWDVKALTAVSTEKFKVLPKLSVMGYFENSYDKNGNLISQTGKLAADAKWSGSISWQFVTPIGPLYLNLEGSGKLSGKVGPKYDYAARKVSIADGSLEFTPGVVLEGGYGIDKVATIGAQGELSVPITIIPVTKGEFEAKASVHVKLVFVIDWKHELASYKTTLWDTTKGKKSKGAEPKGGPVLEGTLSAMETSFSAYESGWNGGKISLYNETDAAESTEDASVNETVLMDGILPSSLPMQAKIGGKNVMVFQSYDSARNTLNSSVLMYSVCEDGIWSEPRPVWDNGCSDMFADMKVINGKLALAWQKAKAEVAGDIDSFGEAVLKDIAKNSEICFAVFDEASGTFTDQTYVTDNESCDTMPRLCGGSDGIILSWVRNDAADLMQETGNNAIYAAAWNGESFEGEDLLAQSFGTIEDFITYQDGTAVKAVYAAQIGEGEEKVNVIFNGENQALESLPELVSDASSTAVSGMRYEDGAVEFFLNGALYRYNTSDKTVESFLAGESAFGSTAKFCSNGEKSGYVWSTYDEDTQTGRIVASMESDGQYSEPVALYEKQGVIWRCLSPVIDENGMWQFAANAQQIEISGSEHHTLYYMEKSPDSRIELAGASIHEDDISDGLTGVDYFVTNKGDTTLQSLKVDVTLADGTVIPKEIPVTILPGESVADTAYVDLPDVDLAQDVSISIYAKDQTNKEDCTVTDKIGLADVAVTGTAKEAGSDVVVTAALSNSSTVDADTTLRLYSDETQTKELCAAREETIAAGESRQVQITIKKSDIAYNQNDAAYLTLKADVKGGDYREDDNISYVILYKPKTDSKTPETQIGTGKKPSKIIPKPTSIKGKIKAKKKSFLVTWKKQSGATGYQVQYSTNKKFTKKTTKVKTVKGASKTKLTVKKLKAKKKYFVRVRTVQKVNGTPYYSKWSKAKTVKTKK